MKAKSKKFGNSESKTQNSSWKRKGRSELRIALETAKIICPVKLPAAPAEPVDFAAAEPVAESAPVVAKIS